VGSVVGDEAATAAGGQGGSADAAAAAPGGGGGAADAGGGGGDKTGGIFAPLLPPLQPSLSSAAAAPLLPSIPSSAAIGRGVVASYTPPPGAGSLHTTPEPTAVAAVGAVVDDWKLLLGVERFRVPEVLLQPALAGVDEAGLPELVGWCLSRLAAAERAACVKGGLLLVGGGAGFPGLGPRLEAELMTRLPYGSPMRVVVGGAPGLDGWRGAAHVAGQERVWGRQGGGGEGSKAAGGEAGAPWGGALSRAEYEERGPEYVKEYQGVGTYW